MKIVASIVSVVLAVLVFGGFKALFGFEVTTVGFIAGLFASQVVAGIDE